MNLYNTFYHTWNYALKQIKIIKRLTAFSDVSNELPYKAEVIADNLSAPWAMDISDDGTIYFTERSGNVRKIKGDILLPEPVITLVEPFVSQGEGGLLGLALDSDFSRNHYIYIMYTYREGDSLYNRVVRLLEDGDKAVEDAIIIDNIPGGFAHNGGRIKVGPYGQLYISTGDTGTALLSQDISSTAGKILRLETDGSIPLDNPYQDSPVFSLGLRNPQGLAFGSNNLLYATDHGEIAHDVVNLIQPGANYGWPIVTADNTLTNENFHSPLISSGNETWAPSGLAYITQGPWRGQLLIAALRGNKIVAVTLNEEGTEPETVNYWFDGEYGRLRDVYQGKDGSIYILTNNRDGRGAPQENDDKIIRLIPD
ncbi:MAG: Quinoprotein glucose dehydrogenase [Anaerocolumna sp.]|nr:Quinoprotein glucose dehydrogenase [Anaerocolumna sp.]